MGDHFLKQIYEDEKIVEKKKQMQYIQDFTKMYYATLNNEVGEKSYLNNEDIRTLNGIVFIRTNEIGTNLSNPAIRIGGCKRELYFKLNGAIKEDREVSEIEAIERNDFIKKQWLNKLDHFKVLGEYSDWNEIKEIFGVPFMTNEKHYIIDYQNGKEYTLLIKPVNDTAFSVRDVVFPTNPSMIPQPMLLHLVEAVVLMFFYKQPVKLLYVGKNNSELYQEFNLGSKSGILTINGVQFDDFRINNLKIEVENIMNIVKGDKVPPRDFYINQILSPEVINKLYDLKIINDRTLRELLSGKSYTEFKCSVCKYKTICESIGDGWKTL